MNATLQPQTPQAAGVTAFAEFGRRAEAQVLGRWAWFTAPNTGRTHAFHVETGRSRCGLADDAPGFPLREGAPVCQLCRTYLRSDLRQMRIALRDWEFADHLATVRAPEGVDWSSAWRTAKREQRETPEVLDGLFDMINEARAARDVERHHAAVALLDRLVRAVARFEEDA